MPQIIPNQQDEIDDFLRRRGYDPETGFKVVTGAPPAPSVPEKISATEAENDISDFLKRRGYDPKTGEPKPPPPAWPTPLGTQLPPSYGMGGMPSAAQWMSPPAPAPPNAWLNQAPSPVPQFAAPPPSVPMARPPAPAPTAQRPMPVDWNRLAAGGVNPASFSVLAPYVATALSDPYHPEHEPALAAIRANPQLAALIGVMPATPEAAQNMGVPSPTVRAWPPTNRVPQILAEDPTMQGPPIVTREEPLPEQPIDDRPDWEKFLRTPLISDKDVNEFFPFLIGPFALHKGFIKSAAAMTSPEMAAIMAAIPGAGMAAEAAGGAAATGWGVLSAGLSAYFATDIGKGLLAKYPEMEDAWRRRDEEKLLELGGSALVDAAFLYGSAKHAVQGPREMVGQGLDRSRARSQRLGAQEEIRLRRRPGAADIERKVLRGQERPLEIKEGPEGKDTPGRWFDTNLGEWVGPVPAQEFRKAQVEPIPEGRTEGGIDPDTGEPIDLEQDRIARVQNDREKLAQDYFGRPWSELNNRERSNIDEEIAQGGGQVTGTQQGQREPRRRGVPWPPERRTTPATGGQRPAAPAPIIAHPAARQQTVQQQQEEVESPRSLNALADTYFGQRFDDLTPENQERIREVQRTKPEERPSREAFTQPQQERRTEPTAEPPSAESQRWQRTYDQARESGFGDAHARDIADQSLRPPNQQNRFNQHSDEELRAMTDDPEAKIESARRQALSDIDALPPIPEGMVRVYRGEGTPDPNAPPAPDWLRESPEVQKIEKEARGRWWTENPGKAAWHMADAGERGRILYQDIPRDVVDKSRARDNPEAARYSPDFADELFLPQEYVGKGTPVGRGLEPAKTDNVLDFQRGKERITLKKAQAIFDRLKLDPNVDVNRLDEVEEYLEEIRDLIERGPEGFKGYADENYTAEDYYEAALDDSAGLLQRAVDRMQRVLDKKISPEDAEEEAFNESTAEAQKRGLVSKKEEREPEPTKPPVVITRDKEPPRYTEPHAHALWEALRKPDRTNISYAFFSGWVSGYSRAEVLRDLAKAGVPSEALAPWAEVTQKQVATNLEEAGMPAGQVQKRLEEAGVSEPEERGLATREPEAREPDAIITDWNKAIADATDDFRLQDRLRNQAPSWKQRGSDYANAFNEDVVDPLQRLLSKGKLDEVMRAGGETARLIDGWIARALMRGVRPEVAYQDLLDAGLPKKYADAQLRDAVKLAEFNLQTDREPTPEERAMHERTLDYAQRVLGEPEVKGPTGRKRIKAPEPEGLGRDTMAKVQKTLEFADEYLKSGGDRNTALTTLNNVLRGLELVPEGQFPQIRERLIAAEKAVREKMRGGEPEKKTEIGKSAGFETEQGSQYSVSGESTTRFKTPHKGHEPSDTGLKGPSHRTVYVDPDFAREIGMWNTSSGKRKRITLDPKTNTIRLTSDAGRGEGRDQIIASPKYTTEPEIGKSPVELFEPDENGRYRGNHPGNKITRMLEPGELREELRGKAEPKEPEGPRYKLVVWDPGPEHPNVKKQYNIADTWDYNKYVGKAWDVEAEANAELNRLNKDQGIRPERTVEDDRKRLAVLEEALADETKPSELTAERDALRKKLGIEPERKGKEPDLSPDERRLAELHDKDAEGDLTKAEQAELNALEKKLEAETEREPEPKIVKTPTGKKLTTKQKAAQQEAFRRDHFTPGNIVLGYGGARDKVLKYEENPAGFGGGYGTWRVQVQAVDTDGSPIKGEHPRWHATDPNPKTATIISRAEKPQTAEATEFERSFRPVSEVRTPPLRSKFRGNVLSEGPFVSDGHSMIDTRTVSDGKRVAALKKPNEDKYAKTLEQKKAKKEYWDKTVQDAQNPLTEVGHTKAGEHPAAFYTDAKGNVYALNPEYVRLIESLTKANEIRGSSSDPRQPVLFLKDGKPVALLMPIRAPETKFDPETARRITREPAKGTLEKLDEAGRKADERLREKGIIGDKDFIGDETGTSSFKYDPEAWRDAALSMAGKVARGAIGTKQFTDKMVKKFGKEIETYLSSLWEALPKNDRQMDRLMKWPLTIEKRDPARGILTSDVGRTLEEHVAKKHGQLAPVKAKDLTRRKPGPMPREADFKTEAEFQRVKANWTRRRDAYVESKARAEEAEAQNRELRKARAIEHMTSDLEYALHQENNGLDWYHEAVERMEETLRANKPELRDPDNMAMLKYLIGITSNGINPDLNLRAALRVWDLYRRDGRFYAYDPDKETENAITFRANSYETAMDNLTRLVQDKGGIRQAVEWLKAEHPVRELIPYGPKEPVPGGADTMRLGSYIFGEKTGAFGANLNGIHTELTADKWWSRTWGRYMGTLMAVDSRGRQKYDDKTNEPLLQDEPRNEGERNLMREVARQVAASRGLTVDKLQAALWYLEQRLYTRMGVDARSIGFDEAAREHFAAEAEERAEREAIRSEGDGGDRKANDRRRRNADARRDERDDSEVPSWVSEEAEGTPRKRVAHPAARKGRKGERGMALPGFLTGGLFGEKPEVPQPGKKGAVPSREKNWLEQQMHNLRSYLDPASLSGPARIAAELRREGMGEAKHRRRQAEVALADAKRYFRGAYLVPKAFKKAIETARAEGRELTDEERGLMGEGLRFIDRVEHGEAQVGESKRATTEQLTAYAGTLRKVLDAKRDELQKRGKLQEFNEHYLGHMWKNREQANAMYREDRAPSAGSAGVYQEGHRPFAGSKAFLKKRTIDSIVHGIERGLEPMFDNPIDQVMAKIQEIDEFLIADKIKTRLKELKIAKYLPEGYKKPRDLETINDPAFIHYGKNTVKIREFNDKLLTERLNRYAEYLDIKHERKVKQFPGYPGAAGLATKGGGVQTQFGSNESTLAHEIGHQLEWKYDLYNKLRARKIPGLAKELRALADLRAEGFNPGSGFKKYIRNKDEKMANAAAVLVYMPERFKAVAPELWDAFRDELYHIKDTGPDGKERFPLRPFVRDMEKSMVLGSNTADLPIPGTRVLGRWYVPPEVKQVIQNFTGRGMSDNKLYRGYMHTSNFLNQAQLLSLYHAGFVTLDAPQSKLALALEHASRGDWADAGKSAASAASILHGPLQYMMRGHQIIKAYESGGPGGFDPEAWQKGYLAKHLPQSVRNWLQEDPGQLKRDIRNMERSGATTQMSHVYATRMADRFMEAVSKARHTQEGRTYNVGKAFITAVPAFFDVMMKPVMEKMVPRMKAGALADITRMESKRLDKLDAKWREISEKYVNEDGTYNLEALAHDPHFAKDRKGKIELQKIMDRISEKGRANYGEPLSVTPEMYREVMGKAQNSIDNRMGQMEYDNKMMNRVVKDALHVTFRSLGWNMGTVQEHGGGLADILMTGKRIQQGDPVVTHKMAYLAGTVFTNALIGGIMTELMTRDHEDPEKRGYHLGEGKSLFFPRTGNTDEHGRDERLSQPTYMKEWAHLWYAYQDGDWGALAKMLAAKTNPVLSATKHLIENEDYYNTELYDTDGPYSKQAWSLIGALLKEAAPFAITGMLKEIERGGSTASKILPFVGFTPAPKFVNETAFERYMDEHTGGFLSSEVKTTEQAAHGRALREITRAIRRGEGRDELARRVGRHIAAGDIVAADYKKAKERAEKNPYEASFGLLRDYKVVIEAMKRANPEERAKVKEAFLKKIGSLNNQSPNIQQDAHRKIKEAGLNYLFEK